MSRTIAEREAARLMPTVHKIAEKGHPISAVEIEQAIERALAAERRRICTAIRELRDLRVPGTPPWDRFNEALRAVRAGRRG
jgi:hypothetical protein